MITARNAGRVRETGCFGGADPPRCCALSRDGRTIAVGNAIGITLYEAERLEPRGFFRTPSRIDALDFAPDGRVLWAVEEKAFEQPQVLRAWDWPSGTERRAVALPPPTNIWDLRCSSHGGFLVLRGTIWNKLLDLGRGGLLTLPVAGCHAISHDEKVIAVGLRDRVCIFDAQTHAQVWQVHLADPEGSVPEAVNALAFGCDGRWLAIGLKTGREGAARAAGLIQLFDLEAGRVARTIDAAPEVERLAFSTDGALLAIEDGRIVEVASGRIIATLPSQKARVRFLAFAPDRRTLMTGPTPQLWDLESGALKVELDPAVGVSAPAELVSCLDRTEDRVGGLEVRSAGGFQTELSCGAGSLIEVVAGSAVVRRFESPAQSLRGLAVSPDGRLVASQCAKGRLDLLDLQTGRLLRELVPDWPGADPSCPRFSPGGALLAGSLPNYAIGVWRSDGALLHALEGHGGSFQLAFHPHERILASASLDRTVRIWDLDHGNCVRVLPGGRELQSLAFTADGEKLVARSSDLSVQVFAEADDGPPAVTLKPPLLPELPELPQPEPELPHDQAWSAEKARVLGAQVAELLAHGRVVCEACRALTREWVAGTDIYGTPGWAAAARLHKSRLELEGIIYHFGPRFLAVFKKQAFGYAADEEGSCPTCHRRWHYRANYHFGMYDGCLTLWTK